MRLLQLLLVLAIAGCASVQQPISDADRNKVSSAFIVPTVAKAPNMFYLGPGGATGLMFGAIGGALSASSIEESRRSFQTFVSRHGISIEEIVLEEIAAAFRQAGRLPLADAASPQAHSMRIEIFQYGFSIPHGFSSKLVPILGIRCELKDSSGRTVWGVSDRILSLGNPVEPVDPELIRNDAKAMESAWRAAAKHLALAIASRY